MRRFPFICCGLYTGVYVALLSYVGERSPKQVYPRRSFRVFLLVFMSCVFDCRRILMFLISFEMLVSMVFVPVCYQQWIHNKLTITYH